MKQINSHWEYTITADINERKTTCKNSLCRFANCPNGEFRPGKFHSGRKTVATRENMIKPVQISLNKSFAATSLSLFFVLVSYTRLHLYVLYIAGIRDCILVHELSAKDKAMFSFLSPYVGRGCRKCWMQRCLLCKEFWFGKREARYCDCDNFIFNH